MESRSTFALDADAARRRDWHAKGPDPLDVLVVGGGIVGAGIARDAAMRGLRVALVEQDDFAQGTSSRSSRLLHGGLRYLAQGHIGLVREASLEKRVIHRIAPHLAEPLAFVFPTFKDNANWRLWKLKIGVKLYDALCSGRNLGRSEWLSADAVRRKIAGLRTDGLTGAVRYFDGLTQDARLVLDTLRSAAVGGALLANGMRFLRAERAGDAWRCALEDRVLGGECAVTARWVINAAGPWAQRLPHSKLRLRLTKGVHLVVDRDTLPLPDAVVMTEERRILFAIPWGRRLILGTTDTDYAGPLDAIGCDAADVEYILGVARRTFPQCRLERGDIRATWAGVRPLVTDQRGRPSDASRSHTILISAERWLEVAGGKLTTYRRMAEKAVDIVARDLRNTARCRTATEALVPPEQAAGISGIVPPAVTRQAVEHYCRNEWARHLDDVMIRRSSWHYYVDEPASAAAQVAGFMADVWGWDAATTEREVARYAAVAAAACPPPV